MGRDQNDDKKRALVMGKFKFLFQDEAEDLEEGDKFKLAIVQNKLLGELINASSIYTFVSYFRSSKVCG